MKILVLTFYFSPDMAAGSFRTTALVEELKKAGVSQIEVITTMPNRYHDFDAEALAYEDLGQVKINRVELPGHKNGLLDQIKCFASFARQAYKLSRGKQYDVVFATSSRLMTATLGALIAKRAKAPLYLDIRDIFADTVKDVFSGIKGKVLFPILSLLERWTIRQADAINIVSDGFTAYFTERYGKLPLRVYTNGIDEEFLLDDFSSSGELGESGLFNVLYAGNIGEGQGLQNIIAPLAKALKNKVRFTIIGSGGRLQQLKTSIENVDNVQLLPPVNRQTLRDYYKQADILFLHLNDYDAFLKVLPSKFFEYAATGKPIWAGVAGYAAEFSKKEIENCAVFPPCDIERAVEEFKTLSFEHRVREKFIEKFSRANIMHSMAQDIMSFKC